jgi:dTDP-4-dehydrorhamnose reductase
MLKILLLGNTGQLGWELERALKNLGELVALDVPQINLADPESISRVMRACEPGLVVNAAAYTDVDRAESEPEMAQAVNALGPGVLAEEARRLNAALVHYSTDYVFDGESSRPYIETDPARPLNVYGESKLAGEQAIRAAGGSHLILRTAWLYGMRRSSFVTRVLGWARSGTGVRVVSDQVSNPTWARSLAQLTARVISSAGEELLPWMAERSGLYHLAGDGFASRYEWARMIMELDSRRAEQVSGQVEPALTSDFPTPARRPLFSALDCSKFQATFALKLPAWQEALSQAMGESDPAPAGQ